jgi:FAD synthase
VDIIHFPDDARPARWTQPVLALGNFDGVHRAIARSSIACGGSPPNGATPVVMTFDPPVACRPSDKAPAY